MKNVSYTFRFSPDVLAKLQAIAKREKRSLNNLVALILEDYVEQDKAGQ